MSSAVVSQSPDDGEVLSARDLLAGDATHTTECGEPLAVEIKNRYSLNAIASFRSYLLLHQCRL